MVLLLVVVFLLFLRFASVLSEKWSFAATAVNPTVEHDNSLLATS